jgi:transposase
MTVRFPRERHEMVQAARARQQTPEFHEVYQARCGIEGTFTQTTRNTGMRRARSIGQRKTHLQHLFTALATTIFRLVRWLEGIPFAKTCTSRFGALAA